MMKKTVLILPTLLLLFGGLRLGPDSSPQPRVGELTLTVRSTLSATIKQSGKHDEQGVIHEENEASDRVTFTFSGTQRMDVWRIFEDGELAYDTSPGMESATLTIGGGGSLYEEKIARYTGLVHRIMGSWTYKAPPLPEDIEEINYFNLYKAALGGEYEVVFPNPIIEYADVTASGRIDTKDGTSPYTRDVGWADQSAAVRLMNQALKDPAFTGRFKGVFPDSKRGFSLSQQAGYTSGGTWEDLSRPWLPAEWTGTWTVEYTLSFAPEADTEAVIETPAAYNDWLPAAGPNENMAGPAPLTVQVRVQKKGERNSEAPHKAQFKFELVKTSREKGVCMNWPNEGTDAFDLKIEQRRNPELKVDPGSKGQKAETKEKELDRAHVTIDCFDWGAFARLKVTAVLDDGAETEVVAFLDTDRPQHELRIPKDEDDNKIADAWQNKKGNDVGGPYDIDRESVPIGDDSWGDGLTLFDEYRGFLEDGNHICGNPRVKDFFICNTVGEAAEAGIRLFKNRSGLEVHSKLTEAELGEDRIINRNHTEMYHIVDQHGVKIVSDVLEPGGRAVWEPGEHTIGTPKYYRRVAINFGILGDDSNPTYRAAMVAHELLHCCAVHHHGDVDIKEYLFKSYPRDDNKEIYEFRATIFDEKGRIDRTKKGRPITVRWEETGLELFAALPMYQEGVVWYIGNKQGQHSGDVHCLMRYDVADGYLNNAGEYIIFTDREVAGYDLCSSPAGTGVNEARAPGLTPGGGGGGRREPRYGHAAEGRGNCRGQICVNDLYY